MALYPVCLNGRATFAVFTGMKARFVYLILVRAVVLVCQTEAPARTTFEVVSVKPLPPGNVTRQPFQSECSENGRYLSRGTPVLWAIDWAYELNDYQVAPGWPDWLNAFNTYEVEAVAKGRVTEEQCRLMVQSLFEDRFRLRFHWERKNVTALALVVGKSGPRLSAGGHVTINGEMKQAASESVPPDGWLMSRFANYLASVRGVDRPVLDKTGLTGIYGLTLNYSIADGDGRPDVFIALQEQLGLKLQKMKSTDQHVRDRSHRASQPKLSFWSFPF